MRERPQVLIVRDTRESGEMLESAMAAGVTAAGGDALLAGVLPTPAAPLLVRRHGLQLGGGDLRVAQPVRGQRHQAVRRRRVQARRRHRARDRGRAREAVAAAAADRPRAPPARGTRGLPARAPRRASPNSTSAAGAILLDCANGATYRAAPEIFRRLGAEVEAIADEPDGRNINDGCGSTHLDRLIEEMAARRLRRRLRVRRRRRQGARRRPRRRGRRRR